MGKGGCLGSEAVGKVDLDSNPYYAGFSALVNAVQSLTSTKWAEAKAENHRKLRRAKPPVDGKISWQTMAEHSDAESCWIVVKDKVYDVTEFAPHHPGGNAILAYGGRDATDVFTAFHASGTWSVLRKYYIGDVEAPPKDEMLADFRKLRADMVRAGLFKSSKSFYMWKLLSLLSMYITAAVILVNGRNTWVACWAAAFMLALCWQQTGWLAHDFLHHQVCKNRQLNNVFGFVLGNVAQGFSIDWWKNKHNTHHAVPNECTEDALAMDPDIDTLPLLAWHEDMAKNVPAGMSALLRYQQYFFFPILCFARMMWAQQSLTHAWVMSKVSRQGMVELGLLGVHYLLLLTLAFSTLSAPKALTFLLAAQVLSGFMLALVFVQSHNGMEVYMGQKDFVSAQIVSTRNIDSTLWMDWFTGGLNYQIEHHLFPTLPRHNLQKAKARVVQFCKEHRFVYESCGMDAGTYRVLQRLSAVAAKI